MAIVKYTNKKTNQVYAYESKAVWDPVLKQSRPVRTYLGRVDENGNIQPTTRKKARAKAAAEEGTGADYKAQYDAAVKDIQKYLARITELQEEITKLKSENSRLERTLEKIRELVK